MSQRRVLTAAGWTADEIDRSYDRTEKTTALVIDAAVAFGESIGLLFAGTRLDLDAPADRERLERIFTAFKEQVDPVATAQDRLRVAEGELKTAMAHHRAVEEERRAVAGDVGMLRFALAAKEARLAELEPAAAEAKAAYEAAEAKQPALRERLGMLEAGDAQLAREDAAAEVARAKAAAEAAAERAREQKAAERRMFTAERAKHDADSKVRAKAEAEATDALVAAAKRGKGRS